MEISIKVERSSPSFGRGRLPGNCRKESNFTRNGYAITVPAGKEHTLDVTLLLTTYTSSDNQKWKITKTHNGSYKIKAKSSENYTAKDLVLDVQSYIITQNLNIQQREYLDNDSFGDEWWLYMQKDYTLMYIGYSLGDPLMPPIVNNVSNSLRNNANMSGYAYTALNKDELLVRLSSSMIFSCITHGSQTSIATADGTLEVTDVTDLASNAFSDLEFVYFGACRTGEGGVNGSNLVNAVYAKGANAVLGFTVDTVVVETNLWTEVFMSELSTGCTIDYAMNIADQAVRNDPVCSTFVDHSTSGVYRYLAGSGSSRPCY